MSQAEYPTSGNYRCYIYGIWIDEVVRIEFNEQNAKVPLYSYHRTEYDSVATGKTLVTGNIVMNFRYPGYLTTLLQKLRSGASNPAVLEALAEDSFDLYETLRSMRYDTPEARAERLSKATPESFERDSVIYRAIDRANLMASNEAETIESPLMVAPFDMELRAFTETELPTSRAVNAIKLLHVNITGRSRVISNLSGGGDQGGSGQPIIEVYPFFARTTSEVISWPSRRSESST